MHQQRSLDLPLVLFAATTLKRLTVLFFVVFGSVVVMMILVATIRPNMASTCEIRIATQMSGVLIYSIYDQKNKNTRMHGDAWGNMATKKMPIHICFAVGL